jgi:hypothetical protein
MGPARVITKSQITALKEKGALKFIANVALGQIYGNAIYPAQWPSAHRR